MVIKRSAAEKAEFDRVMRVQHAKDRVSLADVTERMKKRNWEMAQHLVSIGVEVPEFYAKSLGPSKKRK
jgi:hypothetical protein